LLDHGADIACKGGLLGNALQNAIAADKFEIAKLLLSRGAKLDAGAEWDEMLARAKEQERLVRKLVQAQKQENLVEYVEREVAWREERALMKR
jgi:ankyrin repeat protein